MTPRLCEWHACGRVILHKGKRFCSRTCAGRAAARGNSFVPHMRTWQENPPKVVPTSWWLDAAKFYENAHARFPESGTAKVDRAKEFTGDHLGPTLKVRGSRLRREKEKQLGYRA